MSIDISRKRFDASRNHKGVVMQQGRVQLDADWNENVEIRDRLDRSRTYDTFGVCVVPGTTPDAFRIEASGGTLQIGPGRMYVDGVQAENHGADPRAWDPHLAAEAGSAPLEYGDQPYLPEADAEAPLPAGAGTHLVYLDVWQREVNHLIAPDLVERAVGIDTTARTQTVWQVKVLSDVGDVNCATPDADLPGWEEATAPSAGRLSTGALTTPSDPDPCLLPPGGGFKGLENRTYRVEIHDGGVPLEPGDPSDPAPAGTATFKWSRDNGVVASEVVALPALDRVRVSSLGRDEFLRFRDGDWVEVTDDARELYGRPGFLSKITVDEANSELVLDTPLPAGSFPTNPADDAPDPERHTRVRRWDQSGLVGDTSDNDLVDLNAAGAAGAIPVPPAGTPIELESGVVVTFQTPSGGVMRPGDHWIFVARTVDGSVEELDEAPPHGIHHHYCRLALLHRTADGEIDVSDCRHPWGCDCCCEISVAPGQDVQAAVDSLPAKGGRVCLGVGVHRLRRPLLIDGRRNVVVEGCGSGSLLVLDGFADEPVAAVVHVVGGSRDIGLQSLSLYGDRSTALVAVHEQSRDVSISDTVLVNVTPADLADCVLLGPCTGVTVRDSRLLGGRGVVQALEDDLALLADELSSLRPGTEAEEGAASDDVAATAPAPDVTWSVEPLLDLRVEHNLILASWTGVALQDVRDGLIGSNRVAAAMERIEDLRPPDGGGSAAASDVVLAPPATDADAFLDALHEALEAVAWREVDDEDLNLLDVGIDACVAERLSVERNTVRAASGCRLRNCRGATVVGNDLRVSAAGVTTGYAFDLVVDENRIVVLRSVEESDEDPSIDLDTLGNPDPLGAGIALDFARGVRISRNDVRAPSGIVARRSSRSRCALTSGPSLLRVLGVTKLWRVVVELAWIVLHIARMLDEEDDEEAPTRPELEQDLMERWVDFLTGGVVPSFLGKAVLEENLLCVERFGILARQVSTLGGVRVSNNRVSGARFTGIELQPLFSVGIVDRLSGWIRCLLELLIRFMRLLHDALSRFLDGEPIPDGQDATNGFAVIGVTVVTGFMSLCSRICGPGADAPDDGDEEEPGGGPTPEKLRDALGELLEDTCWVDDLLGGGYRVSGNTVRGGGTGIWTGIDGTRVDENRVTVDPDHVVPWEAVALGLLLADPQADPTTAATSGALIDLDRDLLLFGLMNTDTPLEAPESLPNVVGTFSGLVAEDSALRPWVDALEEALAAGESLDAPWRDLLTAVWGELRGYGIVLVGGDFVCTGNRVDAEEVCFAVGGQTGAGAALGGWLEMGGSQRDHGRPCAVGGIWHFGNLAGLMMDLVRALNRDDDGKTDRTVLVMQFSLLLWALYAEKNRVLEVRDSRIRRALVHGISARSVIGLEVAELEGNDVLDAGRIGILFRGGEGTVRVLRNAVRRTEDVYGFLDMDGRSPDFARLIEVMRIVGGADAKGLDEGEALVANNHGDARRLTGDNTSAVRVSDRAVGITANHVRTDSTIAFHVDAAVGLFTDNLSNRPNQVPAPVEEAPNRTNV